MDRHYRFRWVNFRSASTVVNYENIYRLCYIRGPEGILIGLAQQVSEQKPEETPIEGKR